MTAKSDVKKCFGFGCSHGLLRQGSVRYRIDRCRCHTDFFIISLRMCPMARVGLRPLGQTSMQFMMV